MKRYEYNYGKNPEGVLSTISGYATETTNFGETAFGILNKSTRDEKKFTTPEVVSSSTATLFSVGNGTDTDNRKNIIELKADGTVFISGIGGYDGTNPDNSKDLSKELQSVHDDIDNINLDIDRIDSDIDSIHVELDSDLVYTFIVKGENRGTINIPRDQFLKDVNYNEETNILEFLFIVRNEENEEEQKVVKIDMTDLEDIYTNGDGLNLENKKFSIKIDADTQPYINVGPNGLKIIGINEALDKKVSWDESKKVITLPADGSISALRNNGLEGGVLVCQRTYDEGATYVTEVGTTKNNLTLNSIERPKIDFAGGASENIAYESEVKSLQDRMSTAETDIDNLEGRMDTAEGDIDTILSDLSELIGDGEGSVQDQIKTALEDYLPLSGGTMTGNITFGSESTPGTNGHEYVDLGLPSGNLWAKCNIGASSEEEAGLYFQWGDTQGYTAEQVGREEGQKYFGSADYKFSIDGSDSNLSKYNASDSKTVLDLEDDAAHVNMGGSWRIPTFEEYKELCFNTDIYLVPTEGEEIRGTAQEQSGYVEIIWASQTEGTLKGVKFYKKGDKQTYIFVPASGNADFGSMNDVGECGDLWTSSLGSTSVKYTWFFGFVASGGFFDKTFRYSGIPVRGVCPKSDSEDYTGGIIISGKSDTDLVNAAGGTVSISEIGTLLGESTLATKDELADYLTKTDASNTYQPKGNYLTTIPSEYVTDSELNAKGYQTEAQVAAKVSALVDSAPETLDTLNELAAALGDDPNFATTVSTQIGKKLDVATYTTDKATFALKSDALKLYFASMDIGIKDSSGLNLIDIWKDGTIQIVQSGNLESFTQFALKSDLDNYLTSVSWSQVSGKPTFAAVATSGSYNDLTNKPSIPAAITVDSALSSTSTNPVQNKVINSALAGKAANSHTHTVANISNLGSNWATALTAAKPNWITSVNIATISDLNSNWDALLKSDPSGYVTRWPNISEVGSKQNLVIKLNGGTTEGTNQFTYNATAAKSINITPSSIGAAASSHTHTASQVSGLATVATSGSYNDLSNKPSIPQPTVKAASGTLTLWTGTQDQYDTITSKSNTTLYFITEE